VLVPTEALAKPAEHAAHEHHHHPHPRRSTGTR
jgi:hypothetical protein